MRGDVRAPQQGLAVPLVMPILHPARILRGGWSLEPAQRQALLRVRETLGALDRGEPAPYHRDTTQPPPGAILAPTLDDLREWRHGPLGDGVSIDLECAGTHLRGVGFCRLADRVPLWVPILRQGGAQYWTYRDLERVVVWLWEILRSPVLKVWQNGYLFDIPYLERVGFQVEGPHLDTIILSHVHEPEMPKSLQWRAAYHLGWPAWKQLSDTDLETDK